MCYGSGCYFENWMGECTVMSYSSGIKEYFKMSPCFLGGSPSCPEEEEYYNTHADLLEKYRQEFNSNKDLFLVLSHSVDKNKQLENKLNICINWIIKNQLHNKICDKARLQIAQENFSQTKTPEIFKIKCNNDCYNCVKQNIYTLQNNSLSGYYITKNKHNESSPFVEDFPEDKDKIMYSVDKDGQVYFIF